MSSITELKKRQQAELEKIASAANKLTGGFQRDERYWQPVKDAAGNGTAVLRWLPACEGEDFPFVKRYSYGIKGPTGRWYINHSRATLGLPDPAAELWSAFMAEGSEEGKEKAKKLSRRLKFISNVLVVEHPGRREDEGKVFLYEYGKKIYDMLNEAMNPPFPNIKAFNPFDPWAGANFNLRIRKVHDFPNYDKSDFNKDLGPLGTDAEIEQLWKAQHSLTAEVAPDKFKPYDVLKNQLYEVLGLAAAEPKTVRPAPAARADEPADDTPPFDLGQEAGGDEEGMALFRKIAARRGS